MVWRYRNYEYEKQNDLLPWKYHTPSVDGHAPDIEAVMVAVQNGANQSDFLFQERPKGEQFWGRRLHFIQCWDGDCEYRWLPYNYLQTLIDIDRAFVDVPADLPDD